LDKRRRQVSKEGISKNDEGGDCKTDEQVGGVYTSKIKNQKIKKEKSLDTRKTGFCKEKLQNNDIYRNGKKVRSDILCSKTLHTTNEPEEILSCISKKMDRRRNKTSEAEMARIRNRYETTGERPWAEFIGSCWNSPQIGSEADRIVEQMRKGIYSEELSQDIGRRIGTELKSKDNRDPWISAGKSIAERKEGHNENAQLCNSKKDEENRTSLLSSINRWRRNTNDNKMEKTVETKYNDYKHKQTIDGISETYGFSGTNYNEQSRNCIFQNENLFEDNTSRFFESIATIFGNKTTTLFADETISRNRYETEIEGPANCRDAEITGFNTTVKLTQTRIRKKVCIRMASPQRLYDLITTTHSYVANDLVTHNCDLSVNQFIDELPKWVLTLDSFEGMELPKEDYAENYYKLLLKQAKKNAEKMKDELNGLGDAAGVIICNSKDSKEMTGMPMPGGACPTCNGNGTLNKSESDGQNGKKQNGHGNEKTKCPDCDGTGKGDSEKSKIGKINQWLPFNKKEFEEWLNQKLKEGMSPTSKQTGMSGDHSKWSDTRKIPKEMVDTAIKQAIKEAYNKAKFGGYGIGSLPAGIERMCKETMKPVYNFEPYLRHFIDGEIFSKFEQTRKRPNRRYRWEYPGKKTETMGKVGILADTSGSIYDEDLALFAKNLENINQYVSVILFDVDTQINNLREYSKRNFDKILSGGGGTDFSHVFEILEDYKKYKHLLSAIPKTQLARSKMLLQGMQALIIMTDGQASGVPKNKPRKLAVMWAMTKDSNEPPVKWGDVIYLDNAPEKHKKRRN
jgi:predicted metal-dependent peptidase